MQKMEENNTPDLPVHLHSCTRILEGSSKGMEALAALECMKKCRRTVRLPLSSPLYALMMMHPQKLTWHTTLLTLLPKICLNQRTKNNQNNQIPGQLVPPSMHIWEVPVGIEEGRKVEK
jgi:hypothetical protein